MKALFITIILILIPSIIFASDFILGEIETRESYTYIELYYSVEGEYQPFTEILSQTKNDRDKIYVRILGEFSEETNSELLSYYSQYIPNELEKALASSGNLHNPALEPLIQNFTKAFRTTELFKSIESELNKKGFNITEIEFEKYTIDTNTTPRIWVADIWLKSKKIAQQLNTPESQGGARVPD